RVEAVRYWGPISASFLSVAVLASTLVLQTIQFCDSVKRQTAALEQKSGTVQAQIEAHEDTQWREALKIIADKPNFVNGAAGITLLRYFIKSPRHGAEARDLSVTLAGHMIESEQFRILFPDLINVSDPNDLPRALRLNRDIARVNANLWSDI